jgi:hypothetical protein
MSIVNCSASEGATGSCSASRHVIVKRPGTLSTAPSSPGPSAVQFSGTTVPGFARGTVSLPEPNSPTRCFLLMAGRRARMAARSIFAPPRPPVPPMPVELAVPGGPGAPGALAAPAAPAAPVASAAPAVPAAPAALAALSFSTSRLRKAPTSLANLSSSRNAPCSQPPPGVRKRSVAPHKMPSLALDLTAPHPPPVPELGQRASSAFFGAMAGRASRGTGSSLLVRNLAVQHDAACSSKFKFSSSPTIKQPTTTTNKPPSSLIRVGAGFEQTIQKTPSDATAAPPPVSWPVSSLCFVSGSGWSVPCVSIQLTLSQTKSLNARLGVWTRRTASSSSLN